MKLFIHQSSSKLIIFFCFLVLTTSCKSSTSSHLKSYEVRKLIIPSGEIIKTYIAKSHEQQRLGLSTIKNKDFTNNEAMFFIGSEMKLRQFWMPETYFDLDIFFLNSELYVLDIHRDLKHSPSSSRDRSKVSLSKEVLAQYVLEIKSSSKLSKKIKRGMVLKWKR